MKKSELEDRQLALAQHLGIGWNYDADLSTGGEGFCSIDEIEDKIGDIKQEIALLQQEIDGLVDAEQENSPEVDALESGKDQLNDDIAILQILIVEDDPELDEDIKDGGGNYTLEYGGQEYIADELWEESLDNYIEECIYPGIEGYENYFDDEKWKDDARIDGRGHSLSGYDGREDEEDVNGTTYYIFRIN